ncbi:MAG: Lsr2 family DNA-binding protein [Streptosporangiaceae bacterium]
MRDTQARKRDVEVHDYLDPEVPMLEHMHHKRRRILHRRGFTTTSAPDTETPAVAHLTGPPTPQRHHTPTGPTSPPAPPTAAQVRAWAKQQGINVPHRGKLSTAVWDQYHAAHPSPN